MSKMFIPPLGAKITLTKPWRFNMFNERRNDVAATALGVTFPPLLRGWENNLPIQVTLPEKTELTIRRIYIRQGATSFDSVTVSTRIGKKQVRFWVKLPCFNLIEFEEAL